MRFGFALLLLLCGLVSWASSPLVEFREMSPKGGFTFGSLHQITEDAYGFIWFASHHGLFRYNTETIDKFVYIPTNEHSIPSNYITSISKDERGTLWFATDNGLCFYNEPLARFERCTFFNSNSEPLPLNTTQIVAGKGDSLWILSDRKLHLARTRSGTFERVVVNPTDNMVSFIYFDAAKSLWLRTSQGMVYRADAPYTQFRTFGQVTNQPILSMLFAQNKLWIGYESFGAECYSLDGKLVGKYGKDQSATFDINSDRVRKIFEDEAGHIWFATYNGIAILKDGRISHFTTKNTRGLMHSSIYDIFGDSKGGIWVSTWAGTLSYANPFDNSFEHISTDQGLSNNVVSAVMEHRGLLWIGTEGGGLNSYNPKSGAVSQHKLNAQLDDAQNVKALEVDQNHALWVGTFNDGLWLIRNFDSNGKPLNAQKVMQGGFYQIKKDGAYVWAATYFGGLFKIHIETLEYNQYPGAENNPNTVHTNNLRTVLVDSRKGIWVGTQRGLCYRKAGSEQFERFFSNPTDSASLGGSIIYSIFEDQHQTIWIGTSSGLSRYKSNSNSFENYSPKNGLPGYEIYGITEDANGHLWISTDNGIARFALQAGQFRNFTQADGLQSNQFNPGSVYRSESGNMYFGGPNGLTIFRPNQIKQNAIAPQPIVVDVLINNQLQKPADTGCVLKESILRARNFELQHDQNSITFRFVANNYLSPEKNTFAYRLVNYDDNWIESGTRNSATYTKIPPGNYIFQVKAANNDGIWNDTPLEIPFRVEAPWWKRWYAYAAYLILALGSTVFMQREILIRHRLRNEVLLEKVKSQSEQELNQAKLTFFTNISHEIKTPLSLILSPLDLLLEKRKSDTELIDALTTIKRNGNRLKHLLHQVIDIRRIDAGKLAFAPTGRDIVPLVNDLMSCFALEAQEREIEFRFETEFDSLPVRIDPDKFDKMIFNLLTNAFKFVPDRGEVLVSMRLCNACKSAFLGSEIEGEALEVDVWNSGSVIPENEFQFLFDRFYQGRDSRKHGTGIGLNMVKEYTLLHRGQIDLRSGEQTGTGFTIRIPAQTGERVHTQTDAQPTRFNLLMLDEKPGAVPVEIATDKSRLILVVEDNAELRSFLKRSLAACYTVVTATNGKKGYEQAVELNPDLIVSDVMMPEMNGFDMCRRLKNDLNTSHIPVILLTALSAEDSQIEGYQTGADAYISKPFSEKLLFSQIESLLENRQKLKARFFDADAALNDTDTNDTDTALINKAMTIVEAHLLDEHFTVEILAEKLKISRTSLHRKLRAHTDQSATEFIRYVRLKKALKLLKSGNYSIDEVSYAVGFNTPSYFSQSFKKQFGKSPKEYLAGHK